MRTSTIMTNLGTLVLVVALGSVTAGPFVQDILSGHSVTMMPLTESAEAVTFLVLALMLVFLAPTAPLRLAGVAAAGATSYGLGMWLDLVVSAHTTEALLGLIMGGLALAGAMTGLHMLAHRRRTEVATVARRLCALTTDTTETMRRRYAGTPEASRIQGPMARIVSVERMILDVITDALTEQDADSYACRVAHGLTAMREGIDIDRSRDREGHAAVAAAEYCSRLMNELRTRSPQMAQAMRNTASLRTAM